MSAALLLSLALIGSPFSSFRRVVVAGPVRVGATAPHVELVRAWGEACEVEVQVRSYEPDDSVRRVGRGELDLTLLADPLTEGQKRTLASRPGAVPQVHAVAWEAATLIVHPENPLASIREDEARRLFATAGCAIGSNRISSWNDFPELEAWSSNPIARIIPRRKSPGGLAVRKILWGNCELDENAYQVSSDAARERIVAASPEAIGLVYRLRYIGKARRLPVLAEGATIAATPETSTLNSGAYPFGRKVWLAAPRIYYDPHPAAKLTSFALSPDGQFEVARLGLFPLRSVLLQVGSENRRAPVGKERR